MTGLRIARLLRRIADAVERMSDTELDKFIYGLGAPSPKRRLPQTRKTKSVSQNELEGVVAELHQFSTREEALDLLDRLRWSREELATLARRLNIHTTKDDNVGRIKEKLVEAVIGSRLSSAAIRGEE
jgi:hypothetical protein